MRRSKGPGSDGCALTCLAWESRGVQSGSVAAVLQHGASSNLGTLPPKYGWFTRLGRAVVFRVAVLQHGASSKEGQKNSRLLP